VRARTVIGLERAAADVAQEQTFQRIAEFADGRRQRQPVDLFDVGSRFVVACMRQYCTTFGLPRVL
jgi:hypothetical protein